ncbi:hypothetical protein Pan14r_36750 [Crateriforma conspicua]|uniref:EF-hand domain-containing protein n=2 Tax=Crateriforma conspicua TaxID=2527996 RepID=A0A5C5YAM3_9PLAN|nr:hypothetical protein Pan14r_36750 [Crateriforma conspicua]
MKRHLKVFAISGLLVFPIVASAQPPGRGGPPGMGGPGFQNGGPMEMRSQPSIEVLILLFDQADLNRDGCLTKSELNRTMRSRSNPFAMGGAAGRPPNMPPEGMRPDRPGADGPVMPPGPASKPGEVVSEDAADSLDLNPRQSRQLKLLQAEVDRRLAAILTDEQELSLKNYRPPHPPGQPPQGDGPPPPRDDEDLDAEDGNAEAE